MYTIVTILHVVTSALLILLILLQSGKGAGLAGLFGGGGNDQFFSAPSGGSFMRKATITLAVVFALTSLSLTFMASRRHFESVTTTQQQ